MNLLLLKGNKLFTKKKDLKTNHKDVQNVEEQENNKEITAEITQITTDGKFKGRVKLSFLFLNKWRRAINND